MKENIKTIASWILLIAICYVSYEFGILKYICYGFGILAYLGIGCLISMFCGDEPKPWLEKRPVLLYAFHISIVLFWVPLAIILIIWGCIIFVFELFGIKLEKNKH